MAMAFSAEVDKNDGIQPILPGALPELCALRTARASTGVQLPDREVQHAGKADPGQVRHQQPAGDLKFEAPVTPARVAWDGDGDENLVCGNTAGYVGFIENLDGGNPPRWARPRLLAAGGRTIRIQAGPNGSIQGPCEAKWGYTTLDVADWDQDGQRTAALVELLDLSPRWRTCAVCPLP
jgi:hypothetical protein